MERRRESGLQPAQHAANFWRAKDTGTCDGVRCVSGVRGGVCNLQRRAVGFSGLCRFSATALAKCCILEHNSEGHEGRKVAPLLPPEDRAFQVLLSEFYVPLHD